MKLRGLLLALPALLFVAASADGHTGGLSESELTIQDDGVVHARIAISAQELAALAPVDRDGEARITQAEVDQQQAHFDGLAGGLLELRADGAECPGRLEKIVVGEQNDGVDLFIAYQCSAHPHQLDVQALLLAVLPLSHRHALLMRAGDRTERAALGGPQRHAQITTPFTKSSDTRLAWAVLGALACLLVYVATRKRPRNR